MCLSEVQYKYKMCNIIDFFLLQAMKVKGEMNWQVIGHKNVFSI